MSESKIDKLITQVSLLKADLAAIKRQTEGNLTALGVLGLKIDATGEDLGQQLAEVVNRATAAEAAATALAVVVAELHEEVFGNGGGPPMPGPVFIVVDNETQGETGMADKLSFHVKVEQTKPEDIERTVVTVTMDADGTEQTAECGKPVQDTTDGKFYSETPADSFKGDQDGSGTVKVVNFDDASPTPLESELFEETFTLRDTKAPQKAGPATLVVDSETDQ